MTQPDEQTTSELEFHGKSGMTARIARLLLVHLVIFSISLFLCFAIRHDMRVGEWFTVTFFPWLAIVLFVKLLTFGIMHQYQAWWRYVSVSDIFSIIKASIISTMILIVGWFIAMNIPAIREHMGPLSNVPRSVMFMDWAGSIIIICGMRLAIRIYYEETRENTSGRFSRLLIVGAGNAGEGLLREIQRNTDATYQVVGFIDDDPQKQAVRIHGLPVFGNTAQIREIAEKYNIDEIAIAMPSAPHQQLRKVIARCEGTKLRFNTVPDLIAIASGQLRVSQMRDIDINDLLGRDPVTLDVETISDFVKGKTVMITGAGGSIGSEMCRQVGPFQPKQLLLLEQAENSLFFVERELTKLFPNMTCKALVCDMVDKDRVDYLFKKYKPDIVIHAAAHKHVPLMETNPGEAIKNNVCGTRNIAQAAHENSAKHFVMISTDKAVNPTSVMGSSKRLAEMLIQCINQSSETHFVTVRFGNVLGSAGSVIPIFRQQIVNGGPVTVTHPEMRRYFMTIPEASQLVLQAATMGKGGEIFLLDMGEPVKIVDLAKELITLSGFRVDDDIQIEFTGIRPGEKLFEELAITGESMQATRHPKIAIWKNIPANEKELNRIVEELTAIADQDNHAKIVDLVKQAIPDYVGDVDSMKLHEAHIAQNGEGEEGEKVRK